MNAASSTTRTRAISILPSSFRGGGIRRRRAQSSGDRPGGCRLESAVLGVDRLLSDEALDPHGPLAVVGDDEAGGGEAHAVDVQVDRLLGLAVELEDGARGRADQVADRHAAAAELGPDADLDAAERLVQTGRLRGVRRALVAQVLRAELVERLGHA